MPNNTDPPARGLVNSQGRASSTSKTTSTSETSSPATTSPSSSPQPGALRGKTLALDCRLKTIFVHPLSLRTQRHGDRIPARPLSPRDWIGLLSLNQLVHVNGLRGRIIRDEERLTAKLASLQEDVADSPFAVIAKKMNGAEELTGEFNHAVAENEKALLQIMEEADKLRLNTLKELLSILETDKAVDFLACSKKLHLCVHEWAKKREQRHGLVASIRVYRDSSTF